MKERRTTAGGQEPWEPVWMSRHHKHAQDNHDWSSKNQGLPGLAGLDLGLSEKWPATAKP